MKIAIGSDHAGFRLKSGVVLWLAGLAEHEIVDVGTDDAKQSVDYPAYAFRVAEMVSSGQADRGVLICGTGIGMSIAANKVNGIRAANVWDVTTAVLAAKHNNANVLTLGGRLMAVERAVELIDAWLTTPFEPRHQARLDLITGIEQGKAIQD